MASSPYTSVRSMIQCAHDNQSLVADPTRARAAIETIEKAFYVDHLLTSCNSAVEAVRLAGDVNKILLAGHFALRKWNSNSIQVIARHDCPTATVLGLRWDPTADELFFRVELEVPRPPATKRRVLSEVAQVFDPTGLRAPVVIVGKVFIQTLWSAGITWDAPLTDELQHTWQTFREDLVYLNQVRVPRWLGMHNQYPTTIYGFCGASSRAYAAVVYLTTTYPDERVQISLVTARMKVAPIKGATIPRLELCAAHLLAITLMNIRTALGLVTAPYYLWYAPLRTLLTARVEVLVPQSSSTTTYGGKAQTALPLGPAGQPDDKDLVTIAAEVKPSVVTSVTTQPASHPLTTRCRDGHPLGGTI
ncbi:uncharacterized protein LOC129945133 [Eupeodes corollae]|uniref:uncharacterized protein LOC129945133 n=1 Tax=Eupeodes corollae TaxID=290404 RepID=UPI00249142F3|nr:uncharacterized protein LOC129945133 [Eupeodes corollae]